jgi:hypothetical protein
MKMGAWSPLASTVRYVGDAVAIVMADTKAQARDAAEKPSRSPTRNCRRCRTSARDEARARRSCIRKRPATSIYRLGARRRSRDGTRPSPRPRTCRLHRHRQQPPGAERDGAARRGRRNDKAEDHYTCWTTSQNPHVARLVMSAFYNVAPENKLRVIAPDVGGGFGSKIFIYPEEIVCLWASKKTGVPVKWVADRTESFLTDAHGRDHLTKWKWPSTRTTGSRPEGRHDRQSRRLHVAVLVVGADLSLCDAAVGPVQHPGDLCQSARRLHQHRAGRRLSRRRAAGSLLICWSALVETAARELKRRRPSCGARTSSPSSRIRRLSSWPMTPATLAPRSTRR